MITRMTSLAALVAAGMTLSACQEEEAETTTGEETTSEQSEMTDAETATAGSETAEAEAEPPIYLGREDCWGGVRQSVPFVCVPAGRDRP